MSDFLTTIDYDATIHRDFLDATVREDASLVEICEDRAIMEMRSYLSKRYDCDRLFQARGEERNQLVMMMAMDIAVYHLLSIANPQKLSQVRRDRYDRAMEWLRQVADYKVSIPDAPLLPEETRMEHTPMLVASGKKRHNYM
ncbi:MAG: DUF1320 domain-containing protein [Bacteroidales bacterium]|nr:DUF1320 domain-containing protein [Bacteroidales bacterium]